jgi:hypothetical protein
MHRIATGISHAHVCSTLPGASVREAAFAGLNFLWIALAIFTFSELFGSAFTAGIHGGGAYNFHSFDY